MYRHSKVTKHVDSLEIGKLPVLVFQGDRVSARLDVWQGYSLDRPINPPSIGIGIDWIIIKENDGAVRFLNGKLGALDVTLGLQVESKLEFPGRRPLRLGYRPRLSKFGALDEKPEALA
jgi:hypothetical protein